MRLSTVTALAVVAFMAQGCGSSPPPNDKVADTQAAVRAAREVDANNDPQAALHLRLAEEQLAKAKALIEDGENERAASVLLRADADAELAVALAREASAKAAAEKARKELAELREELQSKN